MAVKGHGNPFRGTLGITLYNGINAFALRAFHQVADAGDGPAHICGRMDHLDDFTPVVGRVVQADDAFAVFFERHGDSSSVHIIFLEKLLHTGWDIS
jgi:hypothetical protein